MSERAWRRRVCSEIEGTRAIDGTVDVPGASIPWTDWRADTLCGERRGTTKVTRRVASVTCPDCLEKMP